MLKNRVEQKEIHLYDNVVFNRPKTTKTEYLQLITDYLLAYPDKNTVETDFPVQLRTGNTITTGVGMKANNATQEVQILKKVYSITPPRNEQSKTVTNE